jgi:hypothetical protein
MATDIVIATENMNIAATEVGTVDQEALLENDAMVDLCPPEVKAYYILRESEANAGRVRLLQKIELPVTPMGF